jgi:hypothetical protein
MGAKGLKAIVIDETGGPGVWWSDLRKPRNPEHWQAQTKI